MPVKPLHDRVLIERIDPAEQKSAGGIIIPDTAKEKPIEGKIVSVGDGTRDEKGELVPLTVKIGDRVLFGKYSGNDVKIGGHEYLIVRESEILAVVSQN
ncbi:MAG: co-chaperone GroES [Candidatus Sumerlaeia bacterium]|nr:co-chaperone GroES [Candidatus Sumerlaeia bacterium]